MASRSVGISKIGERLASHFFIVTYVPWTLARRPSYYRQAQIASAKAKINLYTHNSVGIGEHPDIAAEILKAAKEGAEAQELLEEVANSVRA